jgi:hypothetical protein
LACGKHKIIFTEAAIPQHFDLPKLIILQMYASGFTIACILNQFNVFGVLRRVNFYSRKCSPGEQNYDTYDRKLLAIVETLKLWWHYLKGTNYKVLIQCDHKNLEYLPTSKVLSTRQGSWSEILSAYNFVIQHKEGTMNPTDGPSRRPNYEICYDRLVARLLPAAPVEPYDDLMPAIIAAQASDSLAVDISPYLADRPEVDSTDPTEKETQWKVVTGALTYGVRIYIPTVDSLCGKPIRLFHDNPESVHFGALKTTEVVSRDFNWPAMDSHVRRYVSGCDLCHRITAPRHGRHGINKLFETPSMLCEGDTMDFVTNFVESMASGYTSILIIV